MLWIDPKEELPPQGKQILYFKSGDIYVVQRFGDYWFPIPFYDSKFAFHDAPDLWADIIPPHGFSGKIRIVVPDQPTEMHEIDYLEIYHPNTYREFVQMQKNRWVKN